MNYNQPVKDHQAAGRYFSVQGVQSFVREEGEGEAVICLHGVPSSSFLYRRMLPEFARNGYRGIAFDFPGLGLADRPENFDYSWTGLGQFSSAAIDHLVDGNFHLIIHDIGGPIGAEVVAAMSERILSLTILNTLIVDLPTFKKPWAMRPFEWTGIGELYLKSINPFSFMQLMHLQGVENKAMFQHADAKAYVQLLKGPDKGKAFLKIMRGFETTSQKQALYLSSINQLDVPKQIIWGDKDPALTLDQKGRPTQQATGIDKLVTLPAKHFLQEDQGPAIVAEFVQLNAKQ